VVQQAAVAVVEPVAEGWLRPVERPGLMCGDRWGSTAHRIMRRTPHERLAPYVRSMILLDRSEQPGDEIYVLPDDQATLLFNIDIGRRLDPGGAFASAEGSLQLLGPPTRAYSQSFSPPLTIVVTFRPAGASLIWPAQMNELRDRGADLAQLLGTEATRLAAELTVAASDEARLARLERFLLERLETSSSRTLRATRLVHEAVGELQRRCNVAPISEAFATGLGVDGEEEDSPSGLERSRRQMRRLFQSIVGLNPHTVLRIERFHQALKLASASKPPPWADIAARCGYYDQAHMITDFKDFAGAPPCQALRLLGSSLPHRRGCWFLEDPLPA